jgi:hypothetical protein
MRSRTNHRFQSFWRLETELWLPAGSAEAKVVAARRAMIESLDSMIAAVIVIVLKRPECISDKHSLLGNVKGEL